MSKDRDPRLDDALQRIGFVETNVERLQPVLLDLWRALCAMDLGQLRNVERHFPGLLDAASFTGKTIGARFEFKELLEDRPGV